MPLITIDQFKEGLKAIPGTVTLTILARVVPEMRKTDNPYFGRVYKLVKANGQVGADYERSVNKQLWQNGEDDDFAVGPHKWGEYVDSCFIANKDGSRVYLRFQERSRVEQYFLEENDEQIDPEVLKPWLPKEREQTIKYRNFAVDNIMWIQWGGEIYSLNHE
jgi:hypothetical protein